MEVMAQRLISTTLGQDQRCALLKDHVIQIKLKLYRTNEVEERDRLHVEKVKVVKIVESVAKKVKVR